MKHVSILLLILFLLTSTIFAQTTTPSPISGEKLKTILQDFEKYSEKSMKDWQIPGMAIAIVRGDEVLYIKGFGVKKIGEKEPVTPETIFQIGSTSKAFTSALIASLVDEGKIKWSDPVIDTLPDFRMNDPWVTREFKIEELMEQHSGLPAYSADLLSFLGYDRDYIIHSLRYIKPVSSFRSEFAYVNNLWLVAAKVTEKKTGKTWEENLTGRIFNPLGMSQSSCDLASYKNGKNVAFMHHKEDGKTVALPMDWPYSSWPYTYSPAGGINSNVTDMAKWLRFHMNNGSFEGKQLISKENMAFMHSPKTIAGAKTGKSNNYYCLGWVYTEDNPHSIIWHNGQTSGFHAAIAFVPEEKLGIVILSNLADTSLPDCLAFWFFDKYFGNPEKDLSSKALEKIKKAEEEIKPLMPVIPEKPQPSMELKHYTGTYENDVYGKVKVELKDSNLIMTIGPKNITATLKHWNGDVFMLSVPDLAKDAGFITFTMDYEGNATGFTADILNARDGCGKFDKVEDK